MVKPTNSTEKMENVQNSSVTVSPVTGVTFLKAGDNLKDLMENWRTLVPAVRRGEKIYSLTPVSQ